jgi:hypothetical protein
MGAVFALFAGFYYWAPKIIGKTYNEFLGKIHFFTMFVGVKQTVKMLCYVICITIKLLLSKPISINDIVDRDLKDTDSNDIDKDTLDKKLNELPTPNFPKPKKGKSKIIFEK